MQHQAAITPSPSTNPITYSPYTKQRSLLTTQTRLPIPQIKQRSPC